MLRRIHRRYASILPLLCKSGIHHRTEISPLSQRQPLQFPQSPLQPPDLWDFRMDRTASAMTAASAAMTMIFPKIGISDTPFHYCAAAAAEVR